MPLKIAQNHPETLPLAEAVGKLIQNFGMIEWQTYEWISALQTDSMVLEMAHRSKLRDRVEVIKKMILRCQSLSSEAKSEMVESWASVIPHAEIRNIVAHNGLVMGFPNDDSALSATIKGVINFRPHDKSKEVELISLEEINGSMNATARIGAALLESLKRLCCEPATSAS